MNRHAGKQAFTLLEVLVSVAILGIASILIYSSFTGVLKAYTKGTDYLNNVHHGDYIMEQLVMCLRSAATFDTAPELYGMRLEDKKEGRYPGDSISIVTASTAFMPVDSDLSRGLHRIQITIEDNKDNNNAVAIRALPFLTTEEEEDIEPWFVSSEVVGLECRVYNFDDEDWEDEWPNTNAVPALIELTLYMESYEPGEPPIKIQRAVEIPLGITNWVDEADMRGGGDPREGSEKGEELGLGG